MLKDTAILICRRLTASKTGWSLWRAAKISALLLKRKISFHPPVKTPEHPAAERILMALAGQMRRIPRISRGRAAIQRVTADPKGNLMIRIRWN